MPVSRVVRLSIVYFPMNENNEFVMDVWVKPSIEEIEQIVPFNELETQINEVYPMD